MVIWSRLTATRFSSTGFFTLYYASALSWATQAQKYIYSSTKHHKKETETILKWEKKRQQQRHISSAKDAFHPVRGSHH